MEHARRFDDRWYGKLTAIWPIVVAVAILSANYIRDDQSLTETVEISKATVARVELLEQKDAAKQAILVEIKDQQKEMSHDLKEILRRLR